MSVCLCSTRLFPYSLPRNCEFALASTSWSYLPSLFSPIVHLLSALGIYDYLLTLNQEVRQIWQRKLSWTSVLFVVNRYLTLATSFVMFVKDIPQVDPNSQVS
jgi:hypothetical protein